MIGRASSWLLGLLTLLKLHSYALLSLLIGAYFMGLSQPGREFWADLTGRPSVAAWASTLLAATLWVLSLVWTTSRAQQAFEHDRINKLGTAWPFASPSISRGLTRTAQWIPSLCAGLAVFAVIIGWGGVDDSNESERASTALLLLMMFPVCGSIGGVHLLQTWRTDTTVKRGGLRHWAIWQFGLVLLAWAVVPRPGLVIAAGVSALGAYVYFRRHLDARRITVAAWLMFRVAAIALVFLYSSEPVRCLIHANWYEGHPSWGNQDAVEPSGCYWLNDREELTATALLELFSAFLFVAAVAAALEWLALRLAAHTPAPQKNKVEAAVAVLPIVAGCTLFGAWPIAVGGFFGTLPIVLVALAVWTVFLTWLFVQVPIRMGIGAWPLALPVWLLIVSPWTDNHRMVEASAPATPPKQTAPAPAVCAGNPHPLLCQRYVEWAMHRSPTDAERPAFLVVTSGGGIRAAYWTALVLAKLDDSTCGDFSRSTFAISGVSGGSVGATLFVAAAQQARASGMRSSTGPCEGETAPPLVATMVERFFEHDLMAPLVGSMLFPDAAQRFLPAWVPWGGRGRAFEAAIEHAGRESIGANTLGDAFWSLYSGQARLETPLLMLASTSTKNGFRAVSSAVDPQDPLAYWLQSPEFATQAMRLSTAAHNSARFPLVSPPGRIENQRGELMMRVVDGGYFENSSASTGRTVLRAVSPPSRESKTPLRIILIENDPLVSPSAQCRDSKSEWVPVSAQAEEPVGTSDFAFELSVVLGTLLDTRSARAPWHQSELEQMTCADPGIQVDHVFLKDWDRHRAQEPEPAMSWYLAKSTKVMMGMRSSEESSRLAPGMER